MSKSSSGGKAKNTQLESVLVSGRVDSYGIATVDPALGISHFQDYG